MNRLTKKVSKIEAMLDYGSEYIPSENCHSEFELYYKLGKLEDIEEELGIDLIKAVELCKQVNSKKVVYTKEKWGIDTLKILDELDIELFSHRLYKNARGMYVSLDLYDYGITWALTREELEENE